MRLALVALLAVVVWGCASGKDAYLDGMGRETSGDLAGAAEAYVVALERDPSLPNVPGRLGVAGRGALRQRLAQTGRLDPEGAASVYLWAQSLLDRAAAVGVVLDRPATFAGDRDAALVAAVDALLDQGEAAYGAGDFAAVAAVAGRARRFRPTPDQSAALAALALDAAGAWAEADFDAGRFRAALARADAARSLGPSPAWALRLDDLRGAILDAGRVVVAVLPTEGHEAIPPLVLGDLTDLVGERLTSDPFVTVVDPTNVRRWARSRRGRDLGASSRRLGDAAADLRADLGTLVVLGPVDERERAGDAVTQTVRRRGSPEQATLTIREIDLVLTAEADVVVVEAGSGRAVCDETVRGRGATSYDRAATSGDWRALDLSRRQRAAFADDADDRARDRAFEALRDDLARAAAERLRDCLGALVP